MQFETLGLTGLFASAFISSTIAPGGSEAVLAFLVQQRAISLGALLVVATVGNTLGALTTVWLGKWSSNKYPTSTVLSVKYQKSLSTIRRWGCWALFFSWLPVIGDGLCFASGRLGLSTISSVIAIFIGKGLRYAAVAYAFL